MYIMINGIRYTSLEQAKYVLKRKNKNKNE